MTEQIDAESGAMTPLDPRQIRACCASGSRSSRVVLIASPWSLTSVRCARRRCRQGLVPARSSPCSACMASLVLPGRRYRAWGYREEAEELHIRHGLFVRMLTACRSRGSSISISRRGRSSGASASPA